MYSLDDLITDDHNYAYNQTSVFAKDISIVEKQCSDPTIQTKVLEARLAVNVYDLIYENHPVLPDQKIQVLIPYVRVTLNHHLFLLIEMVEIFSALSREVPKKDIESKANIRPQFIASDRQGKQNVLRKVVKLLYSGSAEE